MEALFTVYKTKELISRAYWSFRRYYPDLPVTIVDNSGGGECTEYIYHLLDLDANTNAIFNSKNEGHGDALHMGINMSQSKYILIMDSDTEIRRYNLLEDMIKLMDDETYAVGRIVHTDLAGRSVNAKTPVENIMDFILIYAMLLNRDMYYKFPKFTRFGLVNWKANYEMHKQGLSKKLLKNFPVTEYVYHVSGGTRAEYGDCEDIVDGFKGKKGDMFSELD